MCRDVVLKRKFFSGKYGWIWLNYSYNRYCVVTIIVGVCVCGKLIHYYMYQIYYQEFLFGSLVNNPLCNVYVEGYLLIIVKLPNVVL